MICIRFPSGEPRLEERIPIILEFYFLLKYAADKKYVSTLSSFDFKVESLAFEVGVRKVRGKRNFGVLDKKKMFYPRPWKAASVIYSRPTPSNDEQTRTRSYKQNSTIPQIMKDN